MAVLDSSARARIKEKIDDKRRVRKEATRLAIQEAAEHIALTQGREALTTKALVQEAHVSERTIFNHFPNINQVLISCLGVRLSNLVAPETFQAPADYRELPEAIESFLLGILADEKTDELLQKFVNLAMTFSKEGDGDLGETLGKDIFQTLSEMSWSLCTEILEKYPNLGRDQEVKIMLYLHNLLASFAYGMARYVGMYPEALEEPVESYRLADLRQSMAWAVRQVGHGRPDLSAE